mgnify:CR=1 FL=1
MHPSANLFPKFSGPITLPPTLELNQPNELVLCTIGMNVVYHQLLCVLDFEITQSVEIKSSSK